MKITSEMKVGEIIRMYPNITNVLMKYGICNCCGGDNTLKKAAKAQKLNIDKLLNEINAHI